MRYPFSHDQSHYPDTVSQRYAHLSENTLLDAANAATRAVGGVMLPMVENSSLQSLHIC